jgi:hypothetical protein
MRSFKKNFIFLFVILTICKFTFGVEPTNTSYFNPAKMHTLQLPTNLETETFNFNITLPKKTKIGCLDNFATDDSDDTSSDESNDILDYLQDYMTIHYKNSNRTGKIGVINLNNTKYYFYRTRNGKINIKINKKVEFDFPIFTKVPELEFGDLIKKTNFNSEQTGQAIYNNLLPQPFITPSSYEKYLQLKKITGGKFLNHHMPELTQFILTYPDGIDAGLDFLTLQASNLLTKHFRMHQLSAYLGYFFLQEISRIQKSGIFYNSELFKYEKNITTGETVATINLNQFEETVDILTHDFLKQHPIYRNREKLIQQFMHDTLLELLKNDSFKNFFAMICNPNKTLTEKSRDKIFQKFRRENQKQIKKTIQKETEKLLQEIKKIGVLNKDRENFFDKSLKEIFLNIINIVDSSSLICLLATLDKLNILDTQSLQKISDILFNINQFKKNAFNIFDFNLNKRLFSSV